LSKYLAVALSICLLLLITKAEEYRFISRLTVHYKRQAVYSSGTIATGGATLPITVASFGRHLEAYSDGTNWVIMRSSGDTASITATSLGLGNVANTAPSDLPISNAVSSAMTLKANLSGANFTGNITGTTIHASTSLLVGGTNLNDIYLRTSNFNTTIGNYILNNNFNTTIGNYVLNNWI
jgi:hypothetical protein